jgi:hypothetical protein
VSLFPKLFFKEFDKLNRFIFIYVVELISILAIPLIVIWEVRELINVGLGVLNNE